MNMSILLEDARDEGKDIGRTEGIAIGKKQEQAIAQEREAKTMKLFQMLIKEKRSADLDRAIADKDYLQSLLDKMDI
ncbi:MAG: hypothetical protein K6E51_10635 [Treponema sp.]|nr:hypothetical protein [Treponema sp.]